MPKSKGGTDGAGDPDPTGDVQLGIRDSGWLRTAARAREHREGSNKRRTARGSPAARNLLEALPRVLWLQKSTAIAAEMTALRRILSPRLYQLRRAVHTAEFIT